MRDFGRAIDCFGSRTGHSAISAQCPVCAKADTAGRFMSTRPRPGSARLSPAIRCATSAPGKLERATRQLSGVIDSS